MCDIGEAIQEVMESYEVEVGGKTHQGENNRFIPLKVVKSISNLNGHSITPYCIHGGIGGKAGKTVPIVKQFGRDRDETKMEEGEYFAIETFGSTGRGRVIEEGACSHYALASELPERYTLQHQSARSLLKSIQRNFGTLPFCRRYLDHAGEKNYLLAVRLVTLVTNNQLNTLVKERLVMDYPPLVDPQPGAMTAQFVSGQRSSLLKTGTHYIITTNLQRGGFTRRRLLENAKNASKTRRDNPIVAAHIQQ